MARVCSESEVIQCEEPKISALHLEENQAVLVLLDHCKATRRQECLSRVAMAFLLLSSLAFFFFFRITSQSQCPQRSQLESRAKVVTLVASLTKSDEGIGCSGPREGPSLSYQPFTSVGTVSVASGGEEVSITILRDTVAPSDREREEGFVAPEPVGARLDNSRACEQLQEQLKHLLKAQAQDVMALVAAHPSLFRNRPGLTSLVEHDVDTGGVTPMKQHPYRLPPFKKLKVCEEVEYMLEIGAIEPGSGEWSSPVILIPKSDVLPPGDSEPEYEPGTDKLLAWEINNGLAHTDPNGFRYDQKKQALIILSTGFYNVYLQITYRKPEKVNCDQRKIPILLTARVCASIDNYNSTIMTVYESLPCSGQIHKSVFTSGIYKLEKNTELRVNVNRFDLVDRKKLTGEVGGYVTAVVLSKPSGSLV
ncbi:hypothetical protein SKAU_G00278750 [Synaphobranchus kaupii]|uniref:THD domain-containing protein n=1 Tax=Synaphobranchus kaupii TaxID=118154 RepID=A0A9Q1EWJ6_SYNKA|nr:hypothetical protein SKAU_G00278750 [Synaphobranchus kaupii]